MEHDLDFEVQPDEIGDGRAGLLKEATVALDRYGRQLAPNRGGETDEGDFAREFSEDFAKIGTPDILPLNLETLSVEPQVETRALLEAYRFYWLKLPVSLVARAGWGFNQLQFKAEFNLGDDDLRRPRVHDALPSDAWNTRAKASAQLSLGLGGDLKIAAGLPPTPLPAGGEVQADASGRVGAETSFVWGPFDYEVRLPTVQRSNLDLHDVRWLLSGKRVVNEQDPGLRVVLRVPRDVERLELRAAFRARRSYDYGNSLVEALKAVPPRVVQFFTRGTPLGDVRTWDLTEKL